MPADNAIDYTVIPTMEAENCSYAVRRYFIAAPDARALFFTPTFAGHYITRASFAIDRKLNG
ncbi:MAG: hypothetical protein IJF67_08190, partial [Clostridia bacterium]|nr:hypothetical protein [Clostridia bacterium]